MNIKVIATADGSSSLYVEELNETYHSRHGAVTESQHVFIKEGLEYITTDHVKILEVGLGTGLNAALSFHMAGNKTIDYHSLEPFPLANKLIEKLNYNDLIHNEAFSYTFKKIQESIISGNSIDFRNGFFQWEKISIQDFSKNQRYNLIYFDAFAPSKQPEMWEKSIFGKLYDCLEVGGVLVTYCAKGQVKRDLNDCGFQVETLTGPPGKKEMIRAQKPNR